MIRLIINDQKIGVSIFPCVAVCWGMKRGWEMYFQVPFLNVQKYCLKYEYWPERMAIGHIKALFFIWEVWTFLSLKLLVDKAAVQLRGALITSGWHGQKLSTLNSSQQLKKLEDKKNYKTSCQKVKLKILAKGHWCENQIYKHLVTVRVPNPLAHGRLPKASKVGNQLIDVSEMSSDLEFAMNLRRYVIRLVLPKDIWPGHLLAMDTYD